MIIKRKKYNYEKGIIDAYQLTLDCPCYECKRMEEGSYAHSCEIYNEPDGIPPSIWNGKTICEHNTATSQK